LTKDPRMDVVCLGMLPLNMIDPYERYIDLQVYGPINLNRPEFMFENKLPESVFLSAKRQMIVLRRGEENVSIKLSNEQNIMDNQRTYYALQQLANNPLYALIIHFMLDWGRKKQFVGNFQTIFGDLAFVILVLELINSSVEDVTLPVDKKEKMRIEPLYLQWSPINDLSQEDTTKAANILLSILRIFCSLLKPDKKGETYIPFLDPSDPSKKRKIIDRPLKAVFAKRVLDQVLFAYLDIIKCNSVDSFFDPVVLEDDYMVYNLPLDTWGSIMFAESYTTKRLAESTGASISIRRTQFRDVPGMVLEARGSPDQLWKVQQSLNELGERSSHFVTTVARDKAFIHGAYQCLFEGARHRKQPVHFKVHSGSHQAHHNGKQLKIPCIEKCLGMSKDLEMFKELFLKQMTVVKNDYDPTYHGVLRLALTFGVYYLIHVKDEDSMTIEQLDTDLSGKLEQAKTRSDSNISGRWRGRGRGRGRGRQSYSSIMPRNKRYIRSSFMPNECKQQQVNEFLKSSAFKLKTKDSKYHVTFKFGAPDYGKRHEGLVVLNSDLGFIEFRLSDLKWLAADISRGYSNDEKLMDVRCKLQSRRIVDIETVQQIDDIKPLLEPNSRLLIQYGENDLYVDPKYHERVTFIRKKEVCSYQYDGPESDDSIWHDMQIEVSVVTEYSNLDSSGRCLDVTTRNEVTVIPNFPALEGDTDESTLETFAEKVWKLICKLGKQFDDQI